MAASVTLSLSLLFLVVGKGFLPEFLWIVISLFNTKKKIESICASYVPPTAIHTSFSRLSTEIFVKWHTTSKIIPRHVKAM